MSLVINRSTAHLLLAVFGSLVIMLGVSWWLVYRSEQRWCGLLTTLDEGYNAPVQPGQPPLNERGRRIAAQMHELRRSFGCNG